MFTFPIILLGKNTNKLGFRIAGPVTPKPVGLIWNYARNRYNMNYPQLLEKEEENRKFFKNTASCLFQFIEAHFLPCIGWLIDSWSRLKPARPSRWIIISDDEKKKTDLTEASVMDSWCRPGGAWRAGGHGILVICWAYMYGSLHSHSWLISMTTWSVWSGAIIVDGSACTESPAEGGTPAASFPSVLHCHHACMQAFRFSLILYSEIGGGTCSS